MKEQAAAKETSPTKEAAARRSPTATKGGRSKRSPRRAADRREIDAHSWMQMKNNVCERRGGVLIYSFRLGQGLKINTIKITCLN
jgi:hypothetical protein